MSAHISLVATYANHDLARDAVRTLRGAGFDMGKLAIVAANDHDPQPGVPLVHALDELDAKQLGCIPRDNLPGYEAELKIDRLLLLAHGTPDEIDQVGSVIGSACPAGWDENTGCAIYYGCMD